MTQIVSSLIKKGIKIGGFIFILAVWGCATDGPLTPESASLSPGYLQTGTGQVQVLTVDPQFAAGTLNKHKHHHGHHQNPFFARKFIEAAEGGVVECGNELYGKTKIKFEEHDLTVNGKRYHLTPVGGQRHA